MKIPVFADELRKGVSERKCRRCGVEKKLRMYRLIEKGDAGAPRSPVCIECEDAHWRKAYRYGE
jgi:hypothetical protein